MTFRPSLLGLALVLTMTASAQEYRGTVLGRVTDSSGAVVAGAAIAVQNVETGVAARTTSNDTGAYQVPFLIPGDYLVTVEHSGFKKVERKDIRVLTSQAVTVDVELTIGATSESVTVTAEPSLLNTVNADLGQVVDKTYVGMVDVSLDRNIVNLRNLAPGVSGGTGTYTSSAQSTFSVGGGGGEQAGVETVVDGMPNTTSAGTMGFVPSMEAVEEVKVHTTMFDAAYGHSNGGALSIVTKSGTNEPHGSIYLYKRWSALNANTWANNKFGLAKSSTAYHQWGFYASGPIWLPKIYNGRNRTFFTVSLERDDDPRPLTAQGRVPTDLERKGDFSQTLNSVGGKFTIYDPSSTVVTGSTATRQAFSGNIIPTSRISPIGAAILSKYPLPNQNIAPQLSALNWFSGSTYTVDQRLFSTRVDHVLNDRHRLSGRFGMLERLQNSNDPFPGIFSYPTSGNTNIGFIDRKRPLGSIDDTIVVSPTLVGSVRASYIAYSSLSNTGGVGMNPKDLQMPDVIVRNQSFQAWPTFNLGENTPTVGATSSFSREEVYSLISTWTKMQGAHSIKFGADYRLNRVNSLSPGSNAAGSFTISPTFTQSDPFTKSTSNTSGSAMATLLLGLADSGNFGANSATSIQNSYTGLFVQDDWQISRKLTLNFGMRYELETPYVERYNRQSLRFDQSATLPIQVPGLPLRGGIQFAGVGGNARAIGSDKNNLGPRFGFAYKPFGNTVVRGGYGIFYSTIAANTTSGTLGSSTSTFFGSIGTFNSVTPYVGSTNNLATPITTLANPFPSGLVMPVGSSVGLLAQIGNSLSFFDDKRVNPYSQQWQIDVQHEFPSRLVVDIAYTGTHSLKEIEAFNMNEMPDIYLAQGAAGNKAITNPFLNIFPSTSTLGTGSTIAQSRLWVQFPQFTSLTMQGANTGNAIYHALQLKAEKRLTHNVNFLATYTLSKLLQNNTTSLINVRHYRGVSALDQRHRVTLAATYALPFQFQGGGLKWLGRQALGGWATSGFLTLASGTPLSVSQANGRPLRLRNPTLSGAVDSRLGDKTDAAGHVLNPYFDTTAFVALPSQYVVPSDGPALDDLRAPGTKSLNMALFKSFPIHDRLQMLIRLDATGVTNTPNFGPPGTNMSQAATFGVISSAGGSRTMQGSARITF
jgi:hypothetical protein